MQLWEFRDDSCKQAGVHADTINNNPGDKRCPRCGSMKDFISPKIDHPRYVPNYDSFKSAGQNFQVLYRQDVCPDIRIVFGAASGYWGYIEFVVTLVFIALLTQMKQIHAVSKDASLLATAQFAMDEHNEMKTLQKKIKALEEQMSDIQKSIQAAS
jgi:hypothetical protein